MKNQNEALSTKIMRKRSRIINRVDVHDKNKQIYGKTKKEKDLQLSDIENSQFLSSLEENIPRYIKTSKNINESGDDPLTLNEDNNFTINETNDDKVAKEDLQDKTKQIPNPLIRMLDRYKSKIPRFGPSILSIIPQTKHYQVVRDRSWNSKAKKKSFKMFKKGCSEPLAFAEFVSLFSNEIKVENSRGLLCELVSIDKGRFCMKLGQDQVLSVFLSPGRAVHAEFYPIDGSTPPYAKLTSPPAACADLKQAFGDRPAIRSVKNCKMCYKDEEVIAVRKVGKNELEVDSKSAIPFLSCFTVAIFMFVS